MKITAKEFPKFDGLVDNSKGKERVGIIGAPGSGKTWAALTFPDPLFLDFDDKLPANTMRIPFCDTAWVASYCPPPAGLSPNPADALDKWLKMNHKKITGDMTLVLDSFTLLDNALEAYAFRHPHLFSSKDGAYDKWKFYNYKLGFFSNIFTWLRLFACNIVIICHESRERNEATGEFTGKIKPVCGGAFNQQLRANLNLFVRQTREVYPGKPTKYLWQVRADPVLFDPMVPKDIYDPKELYIPATYEALQSIKRPAPLSSSPE